MAAAAARKKSVEEEASPSGGKVAMAAAAARKKSATEDVAPAGGIAAMAAAEARMKSAEEEAPLAGGIAAMAAAAAARKKAETENMGAPPAGSIAAMAAAAARKQSAEGEAPPAGGIAAMAAAAARKKSETVDNATGGGIAAMAAAAAKKKSTFEYVATAGGIAAMAAAAARKKSVEEEASPSGGKVAMAAAAARKKSSTVEVTSAGGIAAMAAAAARKKSLAEHTPAVEDEPPAGGIAAMAAAAARKKSVSEDVATAGGIAAMAAAAARKKSAEEEASPAGGIAAMAAAAARKKSETEDVAPEGGISAMAAAAASRKKSAEEEVPIEGEIVVLSGTTETNDTFWGSVKKFSGDISRQSFSQQSRSFNTQTKARHVDLNDISDGKDIVRDMWSNIICSLCEEIKDCSKLDIIDAFIHVASVDISKNPRDIALFMCLQDILNARYSESRDKADLECVRNALKRCLVIADQANSVGMMGWLEYGTSNALDRTMERPLDILAHIGAFHASIGDWVSSVDTLWSLVKRCEFHLPLYHPLTVVSMLDLAAATMEVGKELQAEKLIKRASQRIAFYLGEQEQACFLMWSEKNEDCGESDQYFDYHTHSGLDHFDMLRAYASTLRFLLRRRMSNIVGQNHAVTFLHHCFVGDTLSVLANCVSLGDKGSVVDRSFLRDQQVDDSLSGNSRYIWAIACGHYRFALNGWAKKYGLHHPSVLSTSCGMARCLRELNKRDEAINILSSVIASQGSLSNLNPTRGTLRCFQSSFMFSQLHRYPGKWKPMKVSSTSSYLLSIASCIWSMGLYTIEERPNERGRRKALALLRQGSALLKSAIEDSQITNRTEREMVTELGFTIEREIQKLQPKTSVQNESPFDENNIHSSNIFVGEQGSRKSRIGVSTRRAKKSIDASVVHNNIKAEQPFVSV